MTPENDRSDRSTLGARKVGRPRSKHSSPDYAQMTVYIQRSVRNAVKVRLFEEGREMSALVENLLRRWLDVAGLE
jgi:hypothetical protein